MLGWLVVMGGNVQHDDGDGEAALGLHAVALVGGRDGVAAAVGQVPGHARRRRRVAVVGRRLQRDRVRPDDGQRAVHDGGEERGEDVRQVHGRLRQEDEHGQDGDDDVPVGDPAVGRTSASRLYRAHHA